MVTFRHDYGLALMLSRDRGAPRRTRPEEKDRSMRMIIGAFHRGCWRLPIDRLPLSLSVTNGPDASVRYPPICVAGRSFGMAAWATLNWWFCLRAGA